MNRQIAVCRKWANIRSPPIKTTMIRHCSGFGNKLKNLSQIPTLTSTREDVASYVRFNRDIRVLTSDNYRALYSKTTNPLKSEEELEKIRLQIELICAEYQYFFFTNLRVPSILSHEDMLILLSMKSPESRQLFLIKSYFKDTDKIRSKVKKIIKQSQKPVKFTSPFESGCFTPKGELQYGLWRNTLFSRIRDDFRNLTRTSINAYLWGQCIAFDWALPVRFLNEFPQQGESRLEEPPLANPIISERSYQDISRRIFHICNRNIKSGSSHRPSSFIVHCNLSRENPVERHLREAFDISLLNRGMYNCSEESYLTDFRDKRIVHINPYAETTLDQADIFHSEETVFVFNPYTELFGLRRSVLKQMFHLKMQQEAEHRNVHFRRLPIHDWISQNHHIPLSHFVLALRDALHGDEWGETFSRHFPKKYHKAKCHLS